MTPRHGEKSDTRWRRLVTTVRVVLFIWAVAWVACVVTVVTGRGVLDNSHSRAPRTETGVED